MLKKGLSVLTSSHQSDQIVRNWFALFESYCQSVDYDSAESLFAKESVPPEYANEIVGSEIVIGVHKDANNGIVIGVVLELKSDWSLPIAVVE